MSFSYLNNFFFGRSTNMNWYKYSFQKTRTPKKNSVTLISMMIWANVCTLSHLSFVVYLNRRVWTLQFVPNIVPLVTSFKIEYCFYTFVWLTAVCCLWWYSFSLAHVCNLSMHVLFCLVRTVELCKITNIKTDEFYIRLHLYARSFQIKWWQRQRN